MHRALRAFGTARATGPAPNPGRGLRPLHPQVHYAQDRGRRPSERPRAIKPALPWPTATLRALRPGFIAPGRQAGLERNRARCARAKQNHVNSENRYVPSMKACVFGFRIESMPVNGHFLGTLCLLSFLGTMCLSMFGSRYERTDPTFSSSSLRRTDS